MKKTVWIQTTFINGERRYGHKIRSEARMIELFAQMHFLKQAGEDIELDILEHDNMWKTMVYKMTRKNDYLKIEHFYCRQEVEA